MMKLTVNGTWFPSLMVNIHLLIHCGMKLTVNGTWLPSLMVNIHLLIYCGIFPISYISFAVISFSKPKSPRANIMSITHSSEAQLLKRFDPISKVHRFTANGETCKCHGDEYPGSITYVMKLCVDVCQCRRV